MKNNKRQEKTAITPALPPVAAVLVMKYNSGAYFRSLITNCRNASRPAQYLDEDKKRLSDLLECWNELSEYCYATYSAGQLIEPLFYNNVSDVYPIDEKIPILELYPINEEIPILELLGACTKCLTDWGIWRGIPFTNIEDYSTFLIRYLTGYKYNNHQFKPDSKQMDGLRNDAMLQIERIKRDAGLITAPDAAQTKPETPAEVKHSEDFTSVNWYGTKYEFKKGQQAEAIRHLWEAWENNTPTLSEMTIGDKIDSSAANFRLDHLFRKHPAWGKMIVRVGKGTYKLQSPTP